MSCGYTDSHGQNQCVQDGATVDCCRDGEQYNLVTPVKEKSARCYKLQWCTTMDCYRDAEQYNLVTPVKDSLLDAISYKVYYAMFSGSTYII